MFDQMFWQRLFICLALAIAPFTISCSKGDHSEPTPGSCAIDNDCKTGELCFSGKCQTCPEYEVPSCEGGDVETTTFGNYCFQYACTCPPDTSYLGGICQCAHDADCPENTFCDASSIDDTKLTCIDCPQGLDAPACEGGTLVIDPVLKGCPVCVCPETYELNNGVCQCTDRCANLSDCDFGQVCAAQTNGCNACQAGDTCETEGQEDCQGAVLRACEATVNGNFWTTTDCAHYGEVCYAWGNLAQCDESGNFPHPP